MKKEEVREVIEALLDDLAGRTDLHKLISDKIHNGAGSGDYCASMVTKEVSQRRLKSKQALYDFLYDKPAHDKDTSEKLKRAFPKLMSILDE